MPFVIPMASCGNTGFSRTSAARNRDTKTSLPDVSRPSVAIAHGQSPSGLFNFGRGDWLI